jgi:hypothetical protein
VLSSYAIIAVVAAAVVILIESTSTSSSISSTSSKITGNSFLSANDASSEVAPLLFYCSTVVMVSYGIYFSSMIGVKVLLLSLLLILVL